MPLCAFAISHYNGENLLFVTTLKQRMNPSANPAIIQVDDPPPVPPLASSTRVTQVPADYELRVPGVH